jgi:hypothetical protein
MYTALYAYTYHTDSALQFRVHIKYIALQRKMDYLENEKYQKLSSN